jgi:hypothetical protein
MTNTMAIMQIETIPYTAKAHTTGGRDGGASRTSDGEALSSRDSRHRHQPRAVVRRRLVGLLPLGNQNCGGQNEIRACNRPAACGRRTSRVPVCQSHARQHQRGDHRLDRTCRLDATADYSDEEIHAALDVNMPNYASAIGTTNEVVDLISSLETSGISAQCWFHH